MMTPEEIRKKLESMTLLTISRGSGIDSVTLRNFAKGYTKKPSYQLIEILSNYFEKEGTK